MTRRGSDRRRESDPRRIGSMVDRVLGELGHGSSSPSRRIAGAWERVVGDEWAGRCEPTGLRGAVLEVTVASSAASQQLQLRSQQILEALAREVGPGAPTQLRFRVRSRVGTIPADE